MINTRKLTLATVVGARPQFIKAAAFSRLWRKTYREVLIHTGQHHDANMSDIFFKELRIPKPDHYLGIHGSSHGTSTGHMLQQLDPLLKRLKPDGVLVYGDTDSTLAGALAAAKLGLPLFHVEAGLRSFRKTMPEEINRVVTDHVADVLFAPSAAAVKQLAREGVRQGVYNVGDIMLDALRFYTSQKAFRKHRKLTRAPYALATIHRAENTDDPRILNALCAALNQLPLPVLWPMHPRTRKALARHKILLGKNITSLEPVGYLKSLALQASATVILTDSGGVQKEAYYLHKPCVTLRRETEWVETLRTGHNCLGGLKPRSILDAFQRVQAYSQKAWPALYGRGDTAQRIARRISAHLCKCQ